MSIIPDIPKDFFDKEKAIKKVGSTFNAAKESSLAKGLINGFDKITGRDSNTIDLENPDGTNAGSTKGNTMKSGAVSEQTIQRSQAIDSPFTNISTGNNVYYNEEFPSEQYKSTDPAKKNDPPISVGNKPYSIFNKYSLINYRGNPLDISDKGLGIASGRYTRVDSTALINPSATQIIEITSSIPGHKSISNYAYRYQYSDFALTRWYGKISNNYMITLRRFAYPVGDDIITPKGLDAAGKDVVDIQQPDIARAITWMGEPTGNNLADIVKFSHGFNWKDAEAQVQTLNSQNKAASGRFGSIVNSSKFLSAAADAAAGRDAVDANAREQNAGYDAFSNTYPNHVFGPLNVIKNVLVREQGLTFDQEFTLKFEYELKSFDGVNPKVMMLDQLSNILALTYNNAPFWGGSVRYIGGGGVAKPLGDLNKLRSGDYGGFLGSVAEGIGNMFKGVGSDLAGIFSGKQSKTLNNLIGGSLMKMFNTPQGGQAVASLLTGDPTGQWHLTVGNPLNPIMVIGNLAMTGCDVNFEGVNTIHDFPEKLVAVIKLKPARPRDKAEIESMFNAGRGRFYIQPDDVADINKTVDVSTYGNKDVTGRKPAKDDFVNVFRKISNG